MIILIRQGLSPEELDEVKTFLLDVFGEGDYILREVSPYTETYQEASITLKKRGK